MAHLNHLWHLGETARELDGEVWRWRMAPDPLEGGPPPQGTGRHDERGMSDEVRTTAEALEAEAMPRAHAVRTDPDARGAEDGPMPSKLPPPKSPAEWAYRRLILYIARFEEALDAEHEVAMGFTDGGTGVIRIEGMGHFDPDIVTFYAWIRPARGCS